MNTINKYALATGCLLASLSTQAFCAAGDGFTEAATIKDGAQTLVSAILPVIVITVSIGVALSLIKMVKRK